MFLGMDIGIDLGTTTVLVYVKGCGIVLNEPSLAAVEKTTNKVLAVGIGAEELLTATPGDIDGIRPLKDGVISNYGVTARMLKYFIEKTIGRHFFLRPRIAICVPSQVTAVEKRAVEDAAREVGAREVYVIEEPIAAAIGAGLDIKKARGCMVVDIGGGTCDTAVISLGEAVVSSTVKTAGNKFDEAILKYIQNEYGLLIGEKTAEQVKMTIGSVYPRDEEVCMDVMGRDIMTGLPKTITIASGETAEVLSECTAAIIRGIKDVFEKTPPELCADITNEGIVITGGGGLIYGMDKLITQKTGIDAHYAHEDPISCVALGTGKFIEYKTGKGNKKRWRLW